MIEEIKSALYQNLFQNYRVMWVEENDGEAGDPEVTRHLVRAYLAVCRAEAEKKDEEFTIVLLEGDAAYRHMLRVYVAETKRLYLGRKIPFESESVIEGFEWPEEIPTDEEIPRGILTTMGKRLAYYDMKCFLEMREYFLKQNTVAGGTA